MCKIVSYIMQYLLSHTGEPFVFLEKSVECLHVSCTETCALLQNVFITDSE